MSHMYYSHFMSHIYDSMKKTMNHGSTNKIIACKNLFHRRPDFSCCCNERIKKPNLKY